MKKNKENKIDKKSMLNEIMRLHDTKKYVNIFKNMQQYAAQSYHRQN